MKLLFTLWMSICIAPLSAQIINGNFENWINFEGYLLLQGWEIYGDDNFTSVTRDFDSYEGMYAMKVTAMDAGVGAFGRGSTQLSIDYIPPSLDFFVKASSDFGSVSVEIIFYDGEEPVDSFSWYSADEVIEDWTFVSLPLSQNATILTTARINVIAEVGDFAEGSAVISIDQMEFGSVSSVHDQNRPELKLYPNPAVDAFRIGEVAEVDQLTIRDLSGRLVGRYSRAELQNEISIGHLPPACYTVVAHLKSGQTALQKIVIAR